MEHPTLCPQCRHIMVKLRFFDGTSSADALKDGEYDEAHRYSQDGAGCLFALVATVLNEILYGVGSVFKKRRAKKLRDAVLPQYPFSLICPLCHEIVRRR